MSIGLWISVYASFAIGFGFGVWASMSARAGADKKGVIGAAILTGLCWPVTVIALATMALAAASDR